jgi:hypothetical protein
MARSVFACYQYGSVRQSCGNNFGDQFFLSLFRATGLSIAMAFLFEFADTDFAHTTSKHRQMDIYCSWCIHFARAFWGGSAGFQTAAITNLELQVD